MSTRGYLFSIPNICSKSRGVHRKPKNMVSLHSTRHMRCMFPFSTPQYYIEWSATIYLKGPMSTGYSRYTYTQSRIVARRTNARLDNMSACVRNLSVVVFDVVIHVIISYTYSLYRFGNLALFLWQEAV